MRNHTFVKLCRAHHEFPAGGYRWLTVVSPEASNGTELSLEPNVNPAGRAFHEAMFAQMIPVGVFEVDSLEGEYRLCDLVVTFTTKPTPMGPVSPAVLSTPAGI